MPWMASGATSWIDEFFAGLPRPVDPNAPAPVFVDYGEGIAAANRAAQQNIENARAGLPVGEPPAAAAAAAADAPEPPAPAAPPPVPAPPERLVHPYRARR